MSTGPSIIPSSETMNGSVRVPAPSVVAIKLNIDPLTPPGFIFLYKNVEALENCQIIRKDPSYKRMHRTEGTRLCSFSLVLSLRRYQRESILILFTVTS